ncbi:hypothetical protein AKJ48_02910 [candidate division MSBL1 archaeon SCGC-AAA261O19]|uniref:Uncharacterized protein n=2 Tax=candidate division MSBL1 TaxID=215777 RepID=A0A133UZU1_9EURY|nr:hypothetical protein AKJ42_02710 [candidate division MSBL1 archaeon SCGC-AAA261C02]KXB04354.1 hypothetical protein AKJ48_02910 [candidate division MSBL1 archaeon SCGC-AAA261O19]
MVIGKEAWSEVYMSRVLEQIDARILKSLVVLAIISVAFNLLVLSGHGFEWWPLRGVRFLSNPALLTETPMFSLTGHVVSRICREVGQWFVSITTIIIISSIGLDIYLNSSLLSLSASISAGALLMGVWGIGLMLG